MGRGLVQRKCPPGRVLPCRLEHSRLGTLLRRVRRENRSPPPSAPPHLQMRSARVTRRLHNQRPARPGQARPDLLQTRSVCLSACLLVCLSACPAEIMSVRIASHCARLPVTSRLHSFTLAVMPKDMMASDRQTVYYPCPHRNQFTIQGQPRRTSATMPDMSCPFSRT